MATYRSHAGTTYASRTNTTVNKPTGTVDGDEMRMYFLIAAGSVAALPTPTFPSGWTTIGGPTTVSENNNASAFSVRSWTLRKRASSEGTTYTVTHSTASSDCVIVSAQGALDSAGSVSTNDGDGNGNITFNAVTTAAADALLIAFCHNWELWGAGTAPSGTTPTFTERQDSATSLIHVSTGTWTGSGSTGSPTKDSDNTGSGGAQWAAMLVAVENAPAGTTVTPTTAALTLTRFAPTVTATANRLVTPTTRALALTTFAPTVTASDHKTVTPTTASLILTTFAPTVSVSDNKVVTPTTAALVLSAFAPTVTATANQTVTPTTAALVLVTFAPTVTASSDVAPAISTSSFRPDVSIGQFEIERRRKRKVADLFLLLLG